MSEVDRFLSHDAQNIRCVRESDYDALSVELTTLKAGHGEVVAYIRTTDLDRLCQDHVKGCAASLSKSPGTGWIAIYTATPALGVIVSHDLAERLTVPMMLSTPEYLFNHRDALNELRALLAQSQEVKS